jgi:hypothetical protein
MIMEKKMKTSIKGGTIIDGTGAPPRQGNIAIVHSQIAAEGPTASLPEEVTTFFHKYYI